LIDACAGEPEKEGLVVWHPGGHFLPSQRPYLDAAVRFIREQLEKSNGGKKADEEEDVNDMDVPF
jgi:dihydrofolate reductase